jgi:hypothetical protein
MTTAATAHLPAERGQAGGFATTAGAGAGGMRSAASPDSPGSSLPASSTTGPMNL